MSPKKKLDGNRPFDPQEMQERVNRLQREGKMPSLARFLSALKAVSNQEKTEVRAALAKKLSGQWMK